MHLGRTCLGEGQGQRGLRPSHTPRKQNARGFACFAGFICFLLSFSFTWIPRFIPLFSPPIFAKKKRETEAPDRLAGNTCIYKGKNGGEEGILNLEAKDLGSRLPQRA